MSRSRTARAVTRPSLHALAELRNVLCSRAPGAFLTADEASVYLQRARGTIRNLVAAGEIKPDGRGPRRTALFRKSTLDAFIARGAKP